ncbi:hypothetical protein [Algoriphagus terrigena]|uniref:hypothetical protein n=1 Tax=Algoriphagus terrigena TaxID=344884 RepID=UPI00047D02F2|nr:hypothetical protein [Algoriphagus terrigena]
MKFFSLIIGAFVFYLSVMPCCEADDSCVALHDGIEETLPVDHDTEAESPCSPFYSCGTCFGFVAERAVDLTLIFQSSGFRDEIPHFTLIQPAGYFFPLIKPPSVLPG